MKKLLSSTTRLNTKIKLALATYYAHRALSRLQHSANPNAPSEWDKTADLEAIIDVAAKSGWSVEGCAGTFWFTKKRKSGSTKTIQCNETNYVDC